MKNLNVLARASLALVACALAACASSHGGGGGGGGNTTPAPESTCNPQYSKAGCGNDGGTAVIMQCVADAAGAVDAGAPDPDAGAVAAPTGTWKKTSDCASGEYCQMETPAGGGDPAPACKKQAVVTPDAGGSDAGGTDTGATGKTPSQEFACMQTQCAPLIASCMANANCGQLVNCAKMCPEQACADGCSEKVTFDEALLALLLPLDACGKEKGCIEDAPVSSCGDGDCDADETLASCPADCKATGPVCGNGTCEAGESTETCSQDCGTTPECTMNSQCGSGKKCVANKCVTDTPTSCGNGKCEAAEVSALNCNSDCGKTPASGTIPDCAVEVCGSTLQSCLVDQKCLAAGNCAADCGGDESCESACVSAAGSAVSQKIYQIQSCIAQACTGPVCGNGTCEAGESKLSCPSDCGSSGPVCGNGTCEAGESATNCPEDCDGGGSCASSADCGASKNCKGGACVDPPPGTCNGKCGGPGDGGSCYCDDACEGPDYGDCCADKAQYCGAP